VKQAAKVFEVAADKVEKKSYKPNDLVKSMLKLADIAAMGGIELVETAFIGPKPFSRKPIKSETFDADEGADIHEERFLKFRGQLARPGPGQTRYYVPKKRISFLPGSRIDKPGNCLKKGVNKFRIQVDPAGLESGVYTGVVEVTREDPSDKANRILVETVPVTIAL
jgi:hypothetical protein